VEIHGRHRVGKYGVDTDGFEVFLETLAPMNPAIELIVIDEIGKMELFSTYFRGLVYDVLNSDKQVLASIPIKGNEFVRKIKQRMDIRLFEVTSDNRDHLIDKIVEGSR
jgi:nucleoside-triphosphatase